MTISKREKQLEQRVRELENELSERTRDLSIYRDELAKANIKLTRFIQQIQQELHMATVIQKTLVPTEFPHIPGFEFSTKFLPSAVSGGDYFDIFEHDDKFRFGMVMASSSGYTMSALFLSVLFKMAGQLEARKGTPPARILHLIIQELSGNIPDKDQAHVFYAVVDRRDFQMTYSGIGRIVALHYRSDQKKLQMLGSSTEPLSQKFAGAPVESQLYLNPRDRLIICSEGILKASNSKGEAFGEERLFKTILALPPDCGVHELRNEIFFQIERFTQTEVRPQDLTVLVCEVKERILKLARSSE